MNKKEYLLTCLIEECSEVQKAATKALRFGLDKGHPDSDARNDEDIEDELIDVIAITKLLHEFKVIRVKFHVYGWEKEIVAKKKRVLEYMKSAQVEEEVDDRGSVPEDQPGKG